MMSDLCLCHHLEIPSVPTSGEDYLTVINLVLCKLNLRYLTTSPRASHVPTYIAGYALNVQNFLIFISYKTTVKDECKE